jgi:hypothetical protein
MTTVVNAVRDLFSLVTNLKPRFRIHGGTNAENLALQNIQACYQRPKLKNMYWRLCPVCRQDCVWSYPIYLHSYFLGSEGGREDCWYLGVPTLTKGLLIVYLNSPSWQSNSLRGYLTKYDCSSGVPLFFVSVLILLMRTSLSWYKSHWRNQQNGPQEVYFICKKQVQPPSSNWVRISVCRVSVNCDTLHKVHWCSAHCWARTYHRNLRSSRRGNFNCNNSSSV